jgi:hypothetical protein
LESGFALQLPLAKAERKENQMQGSPRQLQSTLGRRYQTRLPLRTGRNAVPQKNSNLLMRNSVLLIAWVVLCSAQFLHAQSENPITINPDAGGFQANPPNIQPGGFGASTPIGPATEYNPEAQPVATNELIGGGGGKKNIIEEATQKLWRLILTVQGGVYYDSNIFITQFNTKSDTVIQLAGGFTFELGDYRAKANNYLTLKYLATGYIYTGRSELNGVDQQVYLQSQYRFDRLTVQGNVSFSYLDGPDRLAGTFTTSYLIDSLLRFLYDYSDKTQLHAEFEQLSDIYPSQINSFEFIGRLGADYAITPKIKIGVEGVVGDLQAQEAGSSIYGQWRFRVAYKATEKLSFLASGGVEVRGYNDRDLIKVTPVFDLSANWSPLVGTSLSLTAFRKVFASPVETGQVFTATGVQANITQAFFQRFNAGIFAGYENDQYNVSGANASNINRSDDYVYLRPNITCTIGGWCNIVLYYQFSRNSSSLNGASFNDHRVGGQVIFAF